MPTLYSHTYLRGDLTAITVLKTGLVIEDQHSSRLHLAGLPPHVAEATAAAFNRAMQAVPNGAGGWTYTTERQIWNISLNAVGAYQAQSDEITGDGDPPWQFESGNTLFECMDNIDATEEEHGCDECMTVCGMDNLTDISGNRGHILVCPNCLDAHNENDQELHEAAGDDKAHAHADLIHANNEGRN